MIGPIMPPAAVTAAAKPLLYLRSCIWGIMTLLMTDIWATADPRMEAAMALGQQIHVGQAAAKSAHQHVGRRYQTFGQPAAVHHLAHQHEQGDGQKAVLFDGTVKLDRQCLQKKMQVVVEDENNGSGHEGQGHWKTEEKKSEKYYCGQHGISSGLRVSEVMTTRAGRQVKNHGSKRSAETWSN